jgi:hypothetical protein
MSNRHKDQSEQRTVDWNKIIHPSLRASNHSDKDIKPITLSSGCILYGYDVFTSYRKKGLKT